MAYIIFNHIEMNPVVEFWEEGNATMLREIVRFAETEGVTEDSVREYLAALLANDENILSMRIQKGLPIGEDLLALAQSDMEDIYERFFGEASVSYKPSSSYTGYSQAYGESMMQLTQAQSPEALLTLLMAHYKQLGCGITGKHIAFKYDGKLEGIEEVALVGLDTLVGIDLQKQELIENTKAFLTGRGANNVLLYGAMGTGKSTAVKALLAAYHKEGLRVIELPKQWIKDIPKLSSYLATKPHKYILFLDDLSFEKHESEYRALKIAMEGQLQANPTNVILYATSNRRHLIRETWADREGEEVHRTDQMQETLSLAERFGVRILFTSPNQKEYLAIVRSMLAEKAIEMDETLEKKAIAWQMQAGGRNGRCAKQFVLQQL